MPTLTVVTEPQRILAPRSPVSPHPKRELLPASPRLTLASVSPLRCGLMLALSLSFLAPGTEVVAATPSITVGSWTPLFQGVELASGQQQGQGTTAPDQQVLCLRVDLSDPDVRLFATPKCTNCFRDTLSENTSHFLEQFGLQVAVNGAFYGSSGQPADTPLGTPDNVLGVAISQGTVVSTPDARYSATLLFTEDKRPFYVPYNSPATNTAGIYTALSGNKPLLINGSNVQPANPSDLDPRTAVGLSQDRRYLFLLTIDGRQSGWSDGADFRDTGEWLRRFGASDGINLDGGGSTTMVMSDCMGTPARLNRPSYVAAYGRERVIGHNLGVSARALPVSLHQFTLEPGSTTALMTWETDSPATTQVEFGITPDYGNTTPANARLTRKHVATLANLQPSTTYYYRAISANGAPSQSYACRFTTLTAHTSQLAFDLSQEWSYTTNNLDAVNWTAPGYDDTRWLGRGPGLLCVEDSATVAPKNTVLPSTPGVALPRTYYFRTHFTLNGDPAGASLTFSNYVDDGAVFYLNGTEIYRLRMPPAPEVITHRTLADGFACVGTAHSGDANTDCPDVFTVGGEVLATLVEGDNVLAVEAHNYTDGSPDLVFGTALITNTATVVPPRLQVWLEEGLTTLFWNGAGFTLQQTTQLGSADAWTDVPGPVNHSPVTLPTLQTTFYRLRR